MTPEALEQLARETEVELWAFRYDGEEKHIAIILSALQQVAEQTDSGLKEPASETFPRPTEELIERYTLARPCCVRDTPDAHTIWLIVGNQQFSLDGYQDTLADANWIRRMLGTAIKRILSLEATKSDTVAGVSPSQILPSTPESIEAQTGKDAIAAAIKIAWGAIEHGLTYEGVRAGPEILRSLISRVLAQSEAQCAAMREALNDIGIAAAEFISDWKKGDFVLPRLAQHDANSLDEKLKRHVGVGDLTSGQQLLDRLVASERQTVMDTECIERLRRAGMEAESKLSQSEAQCAEKAICASCAGLHGTHADWCAAR